MVRVKNQWLPTADGSPMALADGARAAVIGGGPAGSFFSYFFFEMARRAGIDVEVDIFEPRDFWAVGPAACNMCGGIISETLVQNLAADGINLPDTIVQRGIDSYVLHVDAGSVLIDTPLHEMRIGAVHRASGPRDLEDIKYGSFDGYLQTLAIKKGADVRRELVTGIERDGEKFKVSSKEGEQRYDLVVVAAGVNSAVLKLFGEAPGGYQAPETAKTYIREYLLGEDVIARYLGSSMHVFLPNIAGLEFAAIIPKGDYASVCLLGDGIDKKVLEAFLTSEPVSRCMPPQWDAKAKSCQCSPRINVKGAARPYADRAVFIGDAGVTRLFKDGIGAAYRTAKAAARTAVFHGVSANDFERYFMPVCEGIEKDNAIGRWMFGVSAQVQQRAAARRAVLRMTTHEQRGRPASRRMSMILWDLFTGSATYREILGRAMHPAFAGRLSWDLLCSLRAPGGNSKPNQEQPS